MVQERAGLVGLVAAMASDRERLGVMADALICELGTVAAEVRQAEERVYAWAGPEDDDFDFAGRLLTDSRLGDVRDRIVAAWSATRLSV